VVESARGCDAFTITAELPIVLWDNVLLTIAPVQRVNVDSNQIRWMGSYEYDGSPFNGSIYLNDTLTNRAVGAHGFRVMSIKDSQRGVTSFKANDFSVVFDSVRFTVGIADNRIDVGTQPEVTISGVYEFDGKQFKGSTTLSQQSSDLVGSYTYKVESMSDSLYGLTAFSSNNATCVLDRVKITESGVSSNGVETKQPITVWYKAVYEYDSQPFTGSSGNLQANGESLTWSEANQRWEKVYTSETPKIMPVSVTGVSDDKYGLTVFHAGEPINLEWRQPVLEVHSYPLLSIVLGLLTSIIIFYRFKTERLRNGLSA